MVMSMFVASDLVRITTLGARHHRSAALAVHPAGVAVDVVLFLPDRDAMLHFIDDEAAGAESFVSMRRAHAHPHGDIADRERSGAMHAGGARDAEAADGFVHDACAFFFRELRERLVFEPRDGVAFVVIADPAFESREPSAGVVTQLELQRRDVQRRFAEAEFAVHPPATGGMNTTESPAASGCAQSPNSALIATRSIAVGSVKG